ncbi:MAG: hypothetical protein M1820_003949 [Bogoriella megaspora]|nr:MAG: hypothetical protein M1820_003949 [Bogoriella megaspora]
MKLFSTILALAYVAHVSSAAVVSPTETEISKRDAGSDAFDLVSSLYDSILQYDADINSTVAGLTPTSTSEEKAAALSTARSDLETITSLINTATTSISSLTKRSLSPRQAGNETIDLADLLVTLLTEVDNTVNQLIENLGLTGLVDLLTPIEDALTALVGAVGQVVDGVIALVVQLLDAITSALGSVLSGVLGGLTGGLLSGIL